MRFFAFFLLTASLVLGGTSAACVAADGDAKLDAAPSGMVLSNAHLAEILSAHNAASGELKGGERGSSVEEWSCTRAGVACNELLERSGSDYHSRLTNGPLVQEFGQFNDIRWHRDYNGFTSTTTEVEFESFLPLHALDDIRDPKNDASLAGELSDPASYVIKVTRPQHKHPEWVIVDKKTSLVERIEYVYGKRRETATFTDYRPTGGLSAPWHVHFSDGRTVLDSDWTRTSFNQRAVAPSAFAPPASAPVTAWGFGGASSDIRMWGGDVIVRVSVASRGLDFLVDSGASESIIDYDVARELNLPTFGSLTKLDDGKVVSYETMIGDMTAGPLRMQHFAVRATPFHYHLRDDIKIVGVLGYDFLSNVVMKIDYANGGAEFIARSEFDKSNPVPDAYPLSFTFDDGLPMVPMVIGENATRRVVLNTAMPYTLVFGQYMDDHPDDFKDDKNAKRGRSIVPFADEDSFGSEATLWVAHANHMKFGPSDLQNFGVVATNMPYTLSGGDDVDALLGRNYLGYYDLYLDYPHNRIIIKPNELFFKTFKKDN